MNEWDKALARVEAASFIVDSIDNMPDGEFESHLINAQKHLIDAAKIAKDNIDTREDVRP